MNSKILLPTNSVFYLLLNETYAFKDICYVIYPPLLHLIIKKLLISLYWIQKFIYSAKKMITSNVSAALFRSRMPSSACLIKLINFFVKRPGQDNVVTTISLDGFKSDIKSWKSTKYAFQNYLENCHNDSCQLELMEKGNLHFNNIVHWNIL